MLSERKSLKSKLSSAADYIASVQSHYPWSTGTWSYATPYYQALLTLEIIVPGTKVRGGVGASSMNSVAFPAFFGSAVLLFCCVTFIMRVLLVLDPFGTF